MKKITKVLSVFLSVLMAMSVFVSAVSAEEAECTHEYVAETIAATCVEGGFTRYTCSLCGDSYEGDAVEALGHTYGSWIITKDETCAEDGVKYRECSVCDSSVSGHIEIGFVKAIGHDWDDGVVTEATCGQKGSTVYTCRNCGAQEIKDEKPALAHTYGEWVVVTEPTCTESGLKERTCSLCTETAEGHTQSEVISATGHDMQAKTVVPPEYKVQGYTIYECSKCGITENRDFTPALKGRVHSVELGEKIVVNYEEVAELNPVIDVDEDVAYSYSFKSDAENVATVDEDGNIIGKGMGKTVITCTVVDEYGNTETDTVEVQVKFTMANWMTIIRQVLQAAIDIVIGGLFGDVDFGGFLGGLFK